MALSRPACCKGSLPLLSTSFPHPRSSAHSKDQFSADSPTITHPWIPSLKSPKGKSSEKRLPDSSQPSQPQAPSHRTGPGPLRPRPAGPFTHQTGSSTPASLLLMYSLCLGCLPSPLSTLLPTTVGSPVVLKNDPSSEKHLSPKKSASHPNAPHHSPIHCQPCPLPKACS